MPIRTLVVDDEEPARDRLRGLLGELEDLELVGEACDGPQALEQIAGSRPDLVFLDIEMPGLTGMQVAASIPPPRPRIIFCTAYDQYAVDAFEHHAADYLLKPVNRTRLQRAIARVRETIVAEEGRRREMEDATRTQARLLPQRLPPLQTLEYGGVCRPARGVGGDYYDFLALPDGALGLVLADVSGKGMFAGLLMASLQARIQSIAPLHGRALDELVCEINRLLYSSTDTNRYATFFYGVYDDSLRELTYVNAGQAPPIVLRREEGPHGPYAFHRLETGGTVIGLLADAEYRRSVYRFEPGDLFCLFTDGVTEAVRHDGAEFGVERLQSVLARHADLPAERVCAEVVAELDRFTGGAAQRDDITLIVGKVR